MNIVTLVGNVGKDPEYKEISDLKICKFSLATSDGFGKTKATNWHNITAFGKAAEILNLYVRKGTKLAVSGRLQYQKWEDRDGNRRIKAEVILDKFEFVGGKTQSETPVERKPEQHIGDGFGDDDVPF